MSKVCNKCNSTLKDNQKFCTQCGTKYTEAKQTYAQSNKQDSYKLKENNRTLIGSIFSGFIIVLIIIPAYFIVITNILMSDELFSKMNFLLLASLYIIYLLQSYLTKE